MAQKKATKVNLATIDTIAKMFSTIKQDSAKYENNLNTVDSLLGKNYNLGKEINKQMDELKSELIKMSKSAEELGLEITNVREWEEAFKYISIERGKLDNSQIKTQKYLS